MIRLIRLVPVYLLAAVLCGCGSSTTPEANLPPGVKKNPNPQPKEKVKGGKPSIVDGGK